MINIVQIGIGPLGRLIAGYIGERPNMTVVAAVDSDPALEGKDLGELCAQDRLNLAVRPSLGQAEGARRADVAVLTTVSDIARIVPQIEQIVAFGLPVVTTCEELVYPWITAPQQAERLDALAKSKGVAILATGVNPGFMMDTLPVVMSAACVRVDAIKVVRIQDAAGRRLPFRRKIGAGLTLEVFEQKRKDGSLRHVGLSESMHLIASRIGWKLERTEDRITPVVAEALIRSQSMTIEAGCTAGVQQIGRGFVDGQERITLVFRASVGEPSPEDTVEILGEPHLVSSVAGGVHGDTATCAITLNAIERVLKAAPGLRTMADIAPVSFSLAE